MRDPVCGMDISPGQAAATSRHDGQTYYFCARTCKQRFDKDPQRYLYSEPRLPQHARALYDAFGTLTKAFYGPESQGEMSRDLTEAEWDALRQLGHQGECMMPAPCAKQLLTGAWHAAIVFHRNNCTDFSPN